MVGIRFGGGPDEILTSCIITPPYCKRLDFIPTCEDVEGNQVHLGVAVLASLGGGHLHNLARAVLVIDAL